MWCARRTALSGITTAALPDSGVHASIHHYGMVAIVGIDGREGHRRRMRCHGRGHCAHPLTLPHLPPPLPTFYQ